MSRNKNDGDGWIWLLILGIFLMPFIGLYLLCDGKEEHKAVGLTLLIVGIIIYIVVKLQ